MVNGLKEYQLFVWERTVFRKWQLLEGDGEGGGGGRHGGREGGGGGREGAVRFSYLLWILMWPINIVTSGHNYWKLM